MKIRNVRPWPVEIAATGEVVEPDGEVEVDADLGRSLCDQPANWRPVSKKAKKETD